MARKVKHVTITEEGRDKDKIFVLTELPADQAEWWFMRLIIALANAGAKIPDEVLFAGAAGFAAWLPTIQNSLIVAIRAIQGLDANAVRPLLVEMYPCIEYQPGDLRAPRQPILVGNSACQVEEARTWLTLRMELIELHLGFSLADAVSSMGAPPPETPTA